MYGVLTDSSIPKLYLAGILPGLVLAGLFSLTVLIACLLWPSLGGRRTPVERSARMRALPDLIPPLVIFIAVIGSIYAGLATATESAALGVIAALGVAAWHRQLTVRMLLARVRGHHAHHGDDHGHPDRRVLPQFRDHLHRPDGRR